MNDHLIHSINKVTELLKSNNQLREEIDRLQRDKDEFGSKVFNMAIENEKVVSKLEKLEKMVMQKISTPYSTLTKTFNNGSSLPSVDK